MIAYTSLKYEFLQFEDQVCVLPEGLESFYLPLLASRSSGVSHRQIKNNPSLRSSRLCGEKILMQIRHRN
jgi:hypothetical protein